MIDFNRSKSGSNVIQFVIDLKKPVPNSFIEKWVSPIVSLEFEATAELYGIPYRKAVDLSEVAEVFSDLVIGKGPKILEIQVDREENWRCHREIVEAVNSRIDELL